MQRLTENHVRVGRPVPFDCYDGQGHLLLRKGFVVESQNQVDAILERGLFRMAAQSHVPPGDSVAESPTTPFQLLTEFNSRLKQLFANLADELALGKGREGKNFAGRLMQLATDIQTLCRHDTDALLGKIHLDHSGRYSITHALHRAIVCELLGLRKDIPEKERAYLVAAALTCDLSIMQLQDELSRQNVDLLPEQQHAISSHPRESARLLALLGANNPGWATTVIQHHELLNGEGYPFGLSSKDISVGARILKLADTYTAMVSPRAYREGMLSKIAMRDIFLKRGSEIDEQLAVFIVKELGVYPPGAFVKLQNGELAIVIRRGTDAKTPLVKAVVGPRGAPFDNPIKRNTEVNEYKIIDVVERDPIVIIDLHKLWGYEAW